MGTPHLKTFLKHKNFGIFLPISTGISHSMETCTCSNVLNAFINIVLYIMLNL